MKKLRKICLFILTKENKMLTPEERIKISHIVTIEVIAGYIDLNIPKFEILWKYSNEQLEEILEKLRIAWNDYTPLKYPSGHFEKILENLKSKWDAETIKEKTNDNT